MAAANDSVVCGDVVICSCQSGSWRVVAERFDGYGSGEAAAYKCS